MNMDEFIEKYQENIDLYSIESVESLEKFIQSIDNDDFLSMTKEVIIGFKIIHDFIDEFYKSGNDSPTTSITIALNKVLIVNAGHLPELLIHFRNKQQEMLMNTMVDEYA